jgi:plasmid stability protein
MSQFVIRNLEEDVHQRIRDLASDHGQSTEEFVRDLLRSVALQASEEEIPLGTRLTKLFRGIGLRKDEAIPEMKGDQIRVPEFD